jgi:hypothetical protein
MVGARVDLGAYRARPFVTAGAGVFHLNMTGRSTTLDDLPLGASLWAALAVAGAGCAYPLGGPVEVAIEAQALVTAPTAIITVREVVVGRSGAPSLLAQAELRVRLPY